MLKEETSMVLKIYANVIFKSPGGIQSHPGPQAGGTLPHPIFPTSTGTTKRYFIIATSTGVWGSSLPFHAG